MTQEEKELLLTDLLPRILHGIKIHHYQGSDCILKSIDLRTYAAYVEVYDFMALKEFIEDGQRSIFEYKPYLRSLSSMTEEEKDECTNEYYKDWDNGGGSNTVAFYSHIDWLNAHHFDYRGLIEKGLAIEVTKENNPYDL